MSTLLLGNPLNLSPVSLLISIGKFDCRSREELVSTHWPHLNQEPVLRLGL